MSRKEFEDLINFKKTFIISHENLAKKHFFKKVLKSSVNTSTEISINFPMRTCFSRYNYWMADRIIKSGDLEVLFLLNLYIVNAYYCHQDYKNKKLYSLYSFLLKNKSLIKQNVTLKNCKIDFDEDFQPWLIEKEIYE